MLIEIPDEKIKQMVEVQVDASTRKRIKEMQGDYTSKGFIEGIIHDVIWEKVSLLCPDIEGYVDNEVKRCIETLSIDNSKTTKRQLVETIVDNLLERLCD